MANNKILFQENPPNATGGRYGLFFNEAGLVWNGSSHVTYTNSRGSFDVQAVHLGAGLWSLTFPSGLDIGYTYVEIYDEDTPGSQSHDNDQRVMIAGGFWDGTNFGEFVVNDTRISNEAKTRLDESATTIVLGTVGTGSTTTNIVTSALDPAAVVEDQFVGRVVLFTEDTTTAGLRGQGTKITSNTAAGVLTVQELTSTPMSGDRFTIT